MSASPLVARQIPIRDGERVTGFVDLALERAFITGPASRREQIDIPADLAEREAQERASTCWSSSPTMTTRCSSSC